MFIAAAVFIEQGKKQIKKKKKEKKKKKTVVFLLNLFFCVLIQSPITVNGTVQKEKKLDGTQRYYQICEKEKKKLFNYWIEDEIKKEEEEEERSNFHFNGAVSAGVDGGELDASPLAKFFEHLAANVEYGCS